MKSSDKFKEWLKPFGKLDELTEFVERTPVIILVLGARRQGKTATGFRILEDVKARFPHRHACALGFAAALPSWVEKYDYINSTPVNAVVFVDEAGMYGHKKLFFEAMTQAGHNDQTLIFVAQNSANLTIDALRQADVIIFKKPSMMQSAFERRQLQEFFEGLDDKFNELDFTKPFAYVVSEVFRGMVRTKLPSFWSTKISKAFRKEGDLE